MNRINILGAEYTIELKKDFNYENADGVADFSTKKIYINDFEKEPGMFEDIESYKRKVCRHEIIHAFLHESGLDTSSWARNEEIVDWMALQFHKISKAFKEADCL